MSDAILRLLNAPLGDDTALAQLWDEYEFNIDDPDDKVSSVTPSLTVTSSMPRKWLLVRT